MDYDFERKINRRQFIGGLGIGLVLLGLAGCGVKIKSTTTAATSGNTTASLATTGNTTAAYATSANTTTAAATENTTAATTQNTQQTTQQTTTATPSGNTLIVVQGNKPDALIEKGLAALGGIGRWVKNGSKVVIKPNFSVPRKPDEAATTNPQLVAAVVKQCLAAGAKEVKVVDYPFSGPTCLNISGIKDAVESAGGKAYNINAESYFQSVQTGGQTLKTVQFAKDVLNADVFINMPILKNHQMAKVTMSLKNMMGLVWDRGQFHRADLSKAIAEINAYRKPDLIILDAIRGIIDRGPTGPGTIKEWNQVIFGIDPVAVDAYGANLYGIKPGEVGYITEAAKLGVGEMDLNKIAVQKLSV